VKRIKAAFIGLAVLLALFGAALALGFHWAWNVAFGLAYCIDGYGGCPWNQ